MLLRRLAKDMTSSLLSWQECFDFIAKIFDVTFLYRYSCPFNKGGNSMNTIRYITNENARYKRNELEWNMFVRSGRLYGNCCGTIGYQQSSSTSSGTNTKGVHCGQLTQSFNVLTAVRQGCFLSPFLFLLSIYWLMKTSSE